MRRKLQLAILLAFTTFSLCAQRGRQFKPGWNMFSKDQDIQLGKESAAQVEQQMEVVNNPDLQAYITKVGNRLTQSPRADKYPYSFKVVNERSINAFALPGGPMFIHSGLIAVADNEAQLAGVMAHEMSHVILRHGTSNATKAQFAQMALGGLGAVAGGSMLGQIAAAAGGLGANAILLKYSRNAESDADLLGSHIMSDAGYDPVEMARFFEKLESQAQSGGGNGKLAQFFSDHPSPGNRVKSVQNELKFMDKHDYGFQAGGFDSAKRVSAGLPEPKKKPAAPQLGGTTAGSPSDARPSGQLKSFKGTLLTLSIPQNWDAVEDPQSHGLTITSKAGAVQNQQGGVDVGFGVMVNMAPSNGSVNLEADTKKLLQQMQQQNGLQPSNASAVHDKVDSLDALMNVMYSQSMFKGQKEVDAIITVAHPKGLVYMIFIAPESEYDQAQQIFEQMIKSIRFTR